MAEQKSRIFNLLLYPDNSMHAEVIELLKAPDSDYKAVGILHNMDVYEEGEKQGQFKKEHWHFVVKFPNPRYKSGVSIEFAIDERFIDITKSFKGSAKYLLHYGCPDKYQYDPSDLHGTLKQDILKLIDDTSDDTKLSEITSMIDNMHGIISYRIVWDYCLKNGYTSVYRRFYRIFQDIIGEHNAIIYSKREGR